MFICKSSFKKYLKYAPRVNQIARFRSFSSLNREVLKVRMNLHQSGQNDSRQFIINQNQTLKQIEEILKADNQNIKTVQFFVGDKQVDQEVEDLGFLNLSLHNNLKLKIDGLPADFEFGQQLNAASYFEETSLEGELAQYEVPVQDAVLIQEFVKNYKNVLSKMHSSKQAFSEKEMTEALEKAVQTFAEFNSANGIAKNAQLVASLRVSYEEEKAKVEAMEADARKKSNSVINKLIGAQCVQFGVLFYLTYGLYGWDFTEPVSYLLALTTEASILYYFLKHRKTLNMSVLYENKLKSTQDALLAKSYADSTAHLRFLKSKLDMAESKVNFSAAKSLTQ